MTRRYRRSELRGFPKGEQFVPAAAYDALNIGFGVVLTTFPNAVEYVQECGCTAHLTREQRAKGEQRPCPHHGGYSYALYGATRMNGGYLLTRFVYPKQRDSVQLYEFDTFRAESRRHHGTPFHERTAVAVERLAVVRQRLLDCGNDAAPTQEATRADFHVSE